MADITAKMVRELREKSGAGMMECKKALVATNGDVEAAFDELRKSGLKTAAKKAGRDTGEGRLACKTTDDGRSGAMVAIACETDFVAATEDFTGFLTGLAEHVLEHGPENVEQCLTQPWKGDGTVDNALKALVGRLGENIQIAQVQRYENPEGIVSGYVHHDQKQGALVSVRTGASAADAAGSLKELCMHIVVYSPEALDRDSITDEAVEREKAIIREGLAGKPEEIQEKIMVGRIEKFFAEKTLVDQPWIMDDKTSVTKALVGALGDGTAVSGFARFQVGS
jgi:elongation factor Ts